MTEEVQEPIEVQVDETMQELKVEDTGVLPPELPPQDSG